MNTLANFVNTNVNVHKTKSPFYVKEKTSKERFSFVVEDTYIGKQIKAGDDYTLLAHLNGLTGDFELTK